MPRRLQREKPSERAAYIGAAKSWRELGRLAQSGRAPRPPPALGGASRAFRGYRKALAETGRAVSNASEPAVTEP